MKKTTEETLVVPRKIRGTLTAEGNDNYTFTAWGKGEAQQEIIARSGKSKVYNTVGEKQQSTVAHLVIPKDTPDRMAAFRDELEKFSKVLGTPTTIRKPRGRTLLKDLSTQVVASKDCRLVVVMEIPIENGQDYCDKLISQLQNVNQCLVINKQYLNQLASAQQKNLLA